MDYQQKYLKYKNKYLSLNSQIGGNNPQTIDSLLQNFIKAWEAKTNKMTAADAFIDELVKQYVPTPMWNNLYDRIKLVLLGEIYRIQLMIDNDGSWTDSDLKGAISMMLEYKKLLKILTY